MTPHIITATEIQYFRHTLRQYYEAKGRHDMPWRQPLSSGGYDPYAILVSELMLQQTQVARVLPKYQEFMRRYPTADSLAKAPLGDVLRTWQGLGYNRRAQFLWRAGQAIAARETFPSDLADLVALPGVGMNTAGAILAYAYDRPVLFIETNIRTVYIHHFFGDAKAVSDAAIREVLARTVPWADAQDQATVSDMGMKGVEQAGARDFYWALMDYGTWLKTRIRNNGQSRHYTKQTRFEGSRRQVRGQVLRLLAGRGQTLQQLQSVITDDRLQEVLNQLQTEKLIQCSSGRYYL